MITLIVRNRAHQNNRKNIHSRLKYVRISLIHKRMTKTTTVHLSIYIFDDELCMELKLPYIYILEHSLLIRVIKMGHRLRRPPSG